MRRAQRSRPPGRTPRQRASRLTSSLLGGEPIREHLLGLPSAGLQICFLNPANSDGYQQGPGVSSPESFEKSGNKIVTNVLSWDFTDLSVGMLWIAGDSRRMEWHEEWSAMLRPEPCGVWETRPTYLHLTSSQGLGRLNNSLSVTQPARSKSQVLSAQSSTLSTEPH